MVDNLTRVSRSKVMSSIPGRDTTPELIIRRHLWAQGKRYRKHDKSVPGTPDISSNGKKLAIFIDGCFWHGCHRCYKEPMSNVSFWRQKLEYNKKRRKKVARLLRAKGWTLVQYWEHEVLSRPQLVAGEIARLM